MKTEAKKGKKTSADARAQLGEGMGQAGLEARLRAMIDSFDGFIYICSRDYRIEYMNERLIARTGHDGTGELCYRVLHERDEICPWCINERVFAGETVHWEIQSPKDRRWYSIVNTPIYNPDGTLSKQALILDISDAKRTEGDLKHALARLEHEVEIRTAELQMKNRQLMEEIAERRGPEEALAASEERYRSVIDNVGIGISLISPDMKILALNNQMKKWFPDIDDGETCLSPGLQRPSAGRDLPLVPDGHDPPGRAGSRVRHRNADERRSEELPRRIVSRPGQGRPRHGGYRDGRRHHGAPPSPAGRRRLRGALQDDLRDDGHGHDDCRGGHDHLHGERRVREGVGILQGRDRG